MTREKEVSFGVPLRGDRGLHGRPGFVASVGCMCLGADLYACPAMAADACRAMMCCMSPCGCRRRGVHFELHDIVLDCSNGQPLHADMGFWPPLGIGLS